MKALLRCNVATIAWPDNFLIAEPGGGFWVTSGIRIEGRSGKCNLRKLIATASDGRAPTQCTISALLRSRSPIGGYPAGRIAQVQTL